MLGKIRKYFAVKCDTLLDNSGYKATIGRAMFAASGIDLDLPERAECAFLDTAITKGIDASLKHRWACKLDKFFTSPFVTFDGFEEGAAPFEVHRTAFDTRHKVRMYLLECVPFSQTILKVMC